jgi:predicted TPR repeat methyltransferase
MVARRSRYLGAVDKEVRKHLLDARAKTLLDIGTGDGLRISKIVEGVPLRLEGLEASLGMYQQLVNNPRFEKIYHLDVLDFQVNSEKYDVATALWNVFGHIVNARMALQSILNLLNNGGCLMFDVNNLLNVRQYGIQRTIRNWGWEKLNFRKGYLRHNLHVAGVSTSVYFRSPQKYKKMLTKAGFCDIEIVFFDYNSGNIANKYSGQCFIKAYRRD